MSTKISSSASRSKAPATGKGRSNSVRPTTKHILWAKAAGRCQYAGCNCDLIGDLIAGKEDAQFGFVAHIVADAPNGPRGDRVRSRQLADDIRNLMLLCYTHHKLIDVDDVAGHPEAVLLDMKAAHEVRIATVADIDQSRASHILVYTANIGAHASPVTYRDAAAAMVPNRYPADTRPIEIQLIGSARQDADPDFWRNEVDNLRRHFAMKVQERVDARLINHLSVFALAPQPLLVELGRLLGDITDVDVRQLLREPKGWQWAEDAAPMYLDVGRPASTQGKPALVIDISATVTDARVTAALGLDVSIWRISAQQQHNDIVRRQDDLRQFRRTLRGVLNEIKVAHGEDAEIAVFLAVPVSVAVEIGRVWMPKADLPLVIYDQKRAAGGFVKALTIRSLIPECGAQNLKLAG